MFGHNLRSLDGLDIEALQANLGDYVERTERAVQVLARGCGAEAGRELERFRWCRAQLVHERAGGLGSLNVFAQFAAALGQALPDVFEMVLTYRGEGPRGFGYLTQGSVGHSLAQNLGELLRGTLQAFLGSGGDPREAALLADLFKLSFPDLEALSDYAPTAQGCLMGFVPTGDRMRIRAYFNTRLGRAGSHRDQVAAMLTRAGVDGDCDLGAVYDVLYGEVEGARFHGVGCDLDGDKTTRAKLYVRVNTDSALVHLRRVAAGLGISGVDTTALEGHFEAESLANETEIAVALCSDGPPGLKLTLFFPSDGAGHQNTKRIGGYLESIGYNPSVFADCFAALATAQPRTAMRAFPPHGLGVEFPDHQGPKVNLYLQPAL